MTFLGLEEDPQKAKIVFLPAPYDATASYLPGARFGPRRLLEASPYLEFFDEELLCSYKDLPPFLTLPEKELPVAPEEALSTLKEQLAPHLKAGRFPVTLGGEHTVSLAPIDLLRQDYPDLLVVQIDAHADLRATYQGSPLSHACVMRRVREMGAEVVALGVRAISEEEYLYAQEARIPLFWAYQLKKELPSVLKTLATFCAQRPVYVTIDLDGFDPAEIPGVGTPEPGGLSWYEGLAILKTVARYQVVGFDVVELLPKDERSAFFAAKLVYKFISYLFCPQRAFPGGA